MLPHCVLQPRDCSYSLAELRDRLLQLLEEEVEAATGAAAGAAPGGSGTP